MTVLRLFWCILENLREAGHEKSTQCELGEVCIEDIELPSSTVNRVNG